MVEYTITSPALIIYDNLMPELGIKADEYATITWHDADHEKSNLGNNLGSEI